MERDDDSTFTPIGVHALNALATARNLMEKRDINKEAADRVAERIGSDEHDRKDGVLYEGFATAAQESEADADLWVRISRDLSYGRWDKLTDKDRTI